MDPFENLDAVVFEAASWDEAEELRDHLRAGRDAWMHDLRTVVVPLREGPADLADLLRTVERWVHEGHAERVLFDLDGRTYLMESLAAVLS